MSVSPPVMAVRGSLRRLADARPTIADLPLLMAYVYVGTMVIEFEDIYTGKLQRDAQGRLRLHQHLREQPAYPSKAGAGQSCYDEHNTYGGLIMPQFIPKSPQPFQLFSTHQSLIGDVP